MSDLILPKDPYLRYRKREFQGFSVVMNDAVPHDEVWAVQGGKLVAKIVNLAPSQAISQHSQKGKSE